MPRTIIITISDNLEPSEYSDCCEFIREQLEMDFALEDFTVSLSDPVSDPD